MDLTSTVLLSATTALIKRAVDDVYIYGKSRLTYQWDDWRKSIKDRSVARSISKVTHVKTLWNIEKEVSLYNFYYPSQVQFHSGIKKRIDSLQSLGERQNFVIQGTAGQGKSIFLRYLCGQELRGEFTSMRIPIFVELRRIKPGTSLVFLILESLSKFSIKCCESTFEAYAESGKFVLLLDAFDEVDPAINQEILGQVENLAERYADRLQIIITSRPNSDIQYSSKFRVCKLVPLLPSDQLPFLKKICNEKGQAEDLAKVISNSPADVKGLLTTPLMLTLLVMLYKSIQTVPDTVPRFYEELFDVLFYRHDHSKPGFRRKRHTNLDDSTIRSLFSAFCFYVRLKGYGTVSTRQLEECCALGCKSIGISVDPKKFKDEIVKTVCLMQEEGFELSFIHKSVAEYYSASFVRDSSDNFASKFYRMLLAPFKVEEWSLELKFLSQIDRYRHAKYFQIENLSEVERRLNISIQGGVGADDQKTLLSAFCHDSYLRFRDLGDGKYVPVGWGRPVDGNYAYENAIDIWLNTMSASKIEVLLSKDDLVSGKDAPEDNSVVKVKTDICLQRLPNRVCGEAISKAVNYLVETWVASVEVINLEEDKAAMIDQLLLGN